LRAAQGFFAAQGFMRELRGAQGLARQGAAIAMPPTERLMTPEVSKALKSELRFMMFS